MQVTLAVTPPILTPYYDLILWVLIIEAVIVLIAGVVGVGIQWYLKKQRERYERQHSKLKKMIFLSLEEENHPLILSKNLRKVSLLLPTLLEVGKGREDNAWKNLQTNIQENHLLPLARKLAFSRLWTRQFKAVRCFAISTPHVEDEKAILHLLKSKIPIIRYSAAYVAAQLGTPTAFNAILEAMNHSTRYMRSPFLDALRKGTNTYSYLEQRLETETDPHTRVSCLELLADKMNYHILKLLEPDLQSEHKNLKIAAIRALGHFEDSSSTELLMPLLKAPEWEVKAIAARSLGYLKSMEAIPQLVDLCTDSVWWVRMNAALSLKRMGERGIEKLKAIKPEPDRFAYDIANYVLTLDMSNSENDTQMNNRVK